MFATKSRRSALAAWVALTLSVSLTGCSDSSHPHGGGSDSLAPAATATAPPAPVSPSSTSPAPPAPSTPPAAPAVNVYAKTGVGMFTGAATTAKSLVYVPNQVGSSIDVIDPTTFAIIKRYPVAKSPEHVVPSWDMSVLWVNSDAGDMLTPFDPQTGVMGKPVPVPDPYNLYFTPDGSSALVMASRLRRIDVRDPKTMALKHSVPTPCYGVNHADYTADLSTLVVSCEFSGELLVLDREATKVLKVINLNAVKTPGASSAHPGGHGPQGYLRPGADSMPQDVRLTPDGKWFLVADMLRNGVWVIDAAATEISRFIPLELGTHGIYPSRDSTQIYISNRDKGSVSVLDASTLAVVATWTIPGGGSPDMGGVSNDGNLLWLSGRYHAEVYVFDTRTGQLVRKIKTGAGSHGLCVWPQPGTYSLGHTGNMR